MGCLEHLQSLSNLVSAQRCDDNQLPKYSAYPDFFNYLLDWLELGNLEFGNITLLYLCKFRDPSTPSCQLVAPKGNLSALKGHVCTPIEQVINWLYYWMT